MEPNVHVSTKWSCHKHQNLYLYLFQKGETSVIVTGGVSPDGSVSKVEILGNSISDSNIQNLFAADHSMLLHDKDILLCGGYSLLKQCLKLEGSRWIFHSKMNKERSSSTGISMPSASYVISGYYYLNSFEILEQSTTNWVEGSSEMPQIEPITPNSCSIRISDHEFLVIGGGASPYDKILKFDTRNNSWNVSSLTLPQERFDNTCFLYQNKVIIVGGYVISTEHGTQTTNRTDIIDLNGEEMNIRKGGSLNIARVDHGMGVITIDNSSVLIVFGGTTNTYDGEILSSVEVWDPVDESWTISTTLNITEPRYSLGFVTVPNELLCKSPWEYTMF